MLGNSVLAIRFFSLNVLASLICYESLKHDNAFLILSFNLYNNYVKIQLISICITNFAHLYVKFELPGAVMPHCCLLPCLLTVTSLSTFPTLTVTFPCVCEFMRQIHNPYLTYFTQPHLFVGRIPFIFQVTFTPTCTQDSPRLSLVFR